MSPLPGWPARLSAGAVGLRPLAYRDAGAWVELRQRNLRWLAPWEATPPGTRRLEPASRSAFVATLRANRQQARAGASLPFVITYRDQLAGHLTIGNIVRGSLNSGYAGYWVDEAVAGRGVVPTALALAVDHCFTVVGLHRVEANVRPENAASRRVVEKVGFRDEGIRQRYLHIDGAYRDHICYALTTEDVPTGLRAQRPLRGPD